MNTPVGHKFDVELSYITTGNGTLRAGRAIRVNPLE